MTEVCNYKPGDSSWDEYVTKHARGTMFHLTRWQRAVERTFGHQPCSLQAMNGGAIVGVLPLFQVLTLKGKALVSVPYGVYGGILADHPDVELTLLEAARELAVREGAKYVEFRSRDANDLGLPETDLYVHFESELPERPADCLGIIPRKSRAAVRNGRKKFKLRSEMTQDLDRLFDLYALNVRRLGSPTIPFEFLVNLRQEFEGMIDVQHTIFEDRVVCAVLNFYFKDCVIPYYSGSELQYFFTQCNNVMYCDLMEAGVERGFKRFDFGRSRRDTGPYAFKINMGFSPTNLHYQYALVGLKEVPRINPSNPRFELPRRIWSHLPLGLTKLVGPQLVKYIP